MHHLGNWIQLLLGKERLVAQSIKIGKVDCTFQCSCLGVIRDTGWMNQVTAENFGFLWAPWTLELETLGFSA